MVPSFLDSFVTIPFYFKEEKIMDVKDLFKEIKQYEGKQVTLEGWVRNNRNQSNFGFIDFNDGTYFQSLQLVWSQNC
jgi:asparaginyl-tRNA synthetase